MNGLHPGKQILHYRVIDKIGQGGMGEVYRAEDLKLGRRVAIKLLTTSILQKDEQARSRLLREARAASQLNHPNVVTIYSIEEFENSDFIVMEYIEGENLSSVLHRKSLDFPIVLEMGYQLASALVTAHSMGIVHRDIKPGNILMTQTGQTKILDFGLAKLLYERTRMVDDQSEEDLTATGTILGTAAYMSPEQTRGEVLDAKSDVFSLGSVLYQSATGIKPFEGDSILETMHFIGTMNPPPPSYHDPAIPPAFDELIDRTMTKNKEQRWSAMELASALNELRAEFVSKRITSPLTISGSRPQTKYTKSGDINIAYQVLGNGPVDLVFVMGWISHLEYFWEEPSFARFLKRSASFSRLILFDKRGTGLSDRLTDLPNLEQRMDDVRAVMDAVGSQKAVLCGISEGGPMCCLFAATYPERTSALIMIGTYAKRIWDPEYPWAPTSTQREEFFAEIEQKWGGPVGLIERAPSVAHDARFRDWWSTYLRMGASPGAAVALTRMNTEIDIRSILHSIRIPTLILHRTGDRCIKVEEGRYLASRIPAATFIELPGDDHLPFVGDQEQLLAEIEKFLTSLEQSPEPDRILVTLLFAKISNPPLLPGKFEQFHSAVRREAGRYRGRQFLSATDRAILTFDGPARAIRCASAILQIASQMELEIRIGLHTGECDLVGDHVKGHALDVAETILTHARPREILVSETVKDLVAGSGISFEERGAVETPAGLRRLFSPST